VNYILFSRNCTEIGSDGYEPIQAFPHILRKDGVNVIMTDIYGASLDKIEFKGENHAPIMIIRETEEEVDIIRVITKSMKGPGHFSVSLRNSKNNVFKISWDDESITDNCGHKVRIEGDNLIEAFSEEMIWRVRFDKAVKDGDQEKTVNLLSLRSR